VRALRQILLVALTAVAAIWAGRALRDAVDQANPPTPAPAATTPASSSSAAPATSP
jgi:hypothetical protein